MYFYMDPHTFFFLSLKRGHYLSGFQPEIGYYARLGGGGKISIFLKHKKIRNIYL